jgi:AcrR family transcriptional regulator
MRRRKRRSRLEVDDRRAQLIELGIAVFASRTYDDVSIDDVAREAGISKGLLYHYFPGKRAFYVACLREAADRLVETTTHIDDPAALAIDRLRVALDAYLGYVSRHAPAYVAVLRGGIGSDPQSSAIVEETRTRFLARLVEGLGLAQEPPPLLRAKLRGFIGFVEATSLDWVERRDLPQATLRELLVEVLAGLVTSEQH